eukprot:3278030-Amphidinium_carterae.1
MKHNENERLFVNVPLLWERVLRAAISCIEGPVEASRPDRLAGLAWQWNFVHKFDCPRAAPYRPQQKVKHDMGDQGIKLVEAGMKKDAVDVKMKELLGDAHDKWRYKPEPEKEGLLIVVLSGDKDYSSDVRRLTECVWHGGRQVWLPGTNVVIGYDGQHHPAKREYLQTVAQGRVFGN